MTTAAQTQQSQPSDRKLLLIDVYALVYRAFFALPPLTTSKGIPVSAAYGFERMLNRVLNDERPTHAIAVLGLMAAQGALMRRFLQSPVERALWYSGVGVPLYVAGMMVSAFAVRGVAGW